MPTIEEVLAEVVASKELAKNGTIQEPYASGWYLLAQHLEKWLRNDPEPRWHRKLRGPEGEVLHLPPGRWMRATLSPAEVAGAAPVGQHD